MGGLSNKEKQPRASHAGKLRVSVSLSPLKAAAALSPSPEAHVPPRKAFHCLSLVTPRSRFTQVVQGQPASHAHKSSWAEQTPREAARAAQSVTRRGRSITTDPGTGPTQMRTEKNGARPQGRGTRCRGNIGKKKPHCTSAITKRHEDTPRDGRSPKLNHTNNRVRGPRTTLSCSAEGLWVAGSEGQEGGWL